MNNHSTNIFLLASPFRNHIAPLTRFQLNNLLLFYFVKAVIHFSPLKMRSNSKLETLRTLSLIAKSCWVIAAQIDGSKQHKLGLQLSFHQSRERKRNMRAAKHWRFQHRCQFERLTLIHGSEFTLHCRSRL